MKKLLLLIIASVFVSCATEKQDLYNRIDDILLRLPNSSGLYSTFSNDVEYTQNGYYRIFPIGRLIGVKIEHHNATDKEYESLKRDLVRHYKNNPSVNDVYISRGGLVVLDCRR